MDRKIVYAGIFVIILAMFGIEYYMNLSNPILDYSINNGLTINDSEWVTYEYKKNFQKLGEYSQKLSKIDENINMIETETSVIESDVEISLNSRFIFDDSLKPLDYIFNATEKDSVSFLRCEFNLPEVNVSFSSNEETSYMVKTFTDITYLVDNSVLGHWELIIKFGDLLPNKRYNLDLFIPQYVTIHETIIIPDPGTTVLRIGEERLTCSAYRVPDLDLVFYFYEESLVKYHDERQNIEIIRHLAD